MGLPVYSYIQSIKMNIRTKSSLIDFKLQFLIYFLLRSPKSTGKSRIKVETTQMGNEN